MQKSRCHEEDRQRAQTWSKITIPYLNQGLVLALLVPKVVSGNMVNNSQPLRDFLTKVTRSKLKTNKKTSSS